MESCHAFMDNPKVSRSRLFEGGEGGMCRWRKTQVLGTRFRPGFVYNMGDEEASKDAAAETALAVLQAGRSTTTVDPVVVSDYGLCDLKLCS